MLNYWIVCSLVVAALVGTCSPAGASPTTGDVIAAGSQFVELLAKEDFAGAVSRFDATMTKAMPEPQLKTTWQTVQRQAGAFQKQLGTTTSKLGAYDVVLVNCQFEHAALIVKVVFNAAGKVAGLFFLPGSAGANAAPGTPPPYAHTNAFHEQDFTVGHGEWKLPGTLTLPNGTGPWPAVVLVHGSGPNDRDESVGANKPFRDLAQGLASQGIAVLRYEKRTREHAAKFNKEALAKLTVREETIDDALSAVAQLRTTAGLDPKRIFVLGHSLGGTVAPRIGQSGPELAGLIILAGLTHPLEDAVIEQTKYIISLQEKPAAEANAHLTELQAVAAKIKKLTTADASSSEVLLGAAPAYWLDLREHDPLVAVKGLKQPLLILQGGRDYQVTVADFERWRATLGTRPTVTFKLYPKLNHLFITGEGKSSPDEYSQPGHVAEPVVTDIATWIKSH